MCTPSSSSSSTNNEKPLWKLPDEIQFNILSFMPTREVVENVSQIAKGSLSTLATQSQSEHWKNRAEHILGATQAEEWHRKFISWKLVCTMCAIYHGKN